MQSAFQLVKRHFFCNFFSLNELSQGEIKHFLLFIPLILVVAACQSKPLTQNPTASSFPQTTSINVDETDIISPSPQINPVEIEYSDHTPLATSKTSDLQEKITLTPFIQMPTPSHQPSHTPTDTLQPSVTPTPSSSQIILIQFGLYAPVEDPSDVLLGGNSPVYVLYLDGTLLVRGARLGKPNWYMQKKLEPYQMCAIINRLKGEGFFKFSGDGSLGSLDPIYTFKKAVVFDPSTPNYTLQINGDPSKLVTIQAAHTTELVWAIRQSFLFFRNERPGGMQPYHPDRLLLWVEPGRGAAPQGLDVQSWPHDLPGLATLSGGSDGRGIVLKGGAVETIMALFDQHPGGLLFSQFGNRYYVAARPLLPHETPENISLIPATARSFPLPFDCTR